MRIATPLLCLSLAACAGFQFPGEQPAPQAHQAARAASPPAQPSTPVTPSGPELLQQARTYCWVKVEEQKNLRDIDRRIAFIDKCVADEMKPRP